MPNSLISFLEFQSWVYSNGFSLSASVDNLLETFKAERESAYNGAKEQVDVSEELIEIDTADLALNRNSNQLRKACVSWVEDDLEMNTWTISGN